MVCVGDVLGWCSGTDCIVGSDVGLIDIGRVVLGGEVYCVMGGEGHGIKPLSVLF